MSLPFANFAVACVPAQQQLLCHFLQAKFVFGARRRALTELAGGVIERLAGKRLVHRRITIKAPTEKLILAVTLRNAAAHVYYLREPKAKPKKLPRCPT